MCGQVTGRLRRTVGVSVLSVDDRRVHRLGEFESPAGSPAPDVTLFRVASDGRGGFLAPWTVKMPGESRGQTAADSHQRRRRGRGVPSADSLARSSGGRTSLQ